MPYSGYRVAELMAYLQNLNLEPFLKDEPVALEDALDDLPPGPSPALNAVDIALHDLWGRQLGQPLYRLWGLNPARAPATSVTLSIPDDETTFRQQIRAVKEVPLIKLKLGAGDLETDEAVVRVAREETSTQLCVDANSAYPVDEAARFIPRLAQYDLRFIEQPIGGAAIQDWHRLRSRLPQDMPPLIADESMQQISDIFALAGGADGINIKLTKAGGLRQARRMITLARALGLRVMLGCALESSVGITAAAHLAPLVDFADLDGHLFLANDPYVGVRVERGRLYLPEGAGLGVSRQAE